MTSSQERPGIEAPFGPGRRVHVNRTLDLTAIGALGVDLDHTLAVYDDDAVNELAHEETVEMLVEHRGYPRSAVRLPYDAAAAVRGLVAETRHGNLVKLDLHGRVVRARRGDEYRQSGYIATSYGRERLWSPAASRDHSRYQTSSPFDLPAAGLFARLDPRDGFGPLLADVVETLDRVHTRGALKGRILSQPDRYVAPAPRVAQLLARYREAGKATFVLTNSDLSYGCALLDFLLPPERFGGWRELFDAVVVDARKPLFFSGGGREAGVGSGDPVGRARVWRGGCATWLAGELGVPPSGVFFVGDNPLDDAAAARRAGWRTGLVVPELESARLEAPVGSSASTDGPGGEAGWGSPLIEGDLPTSFGRQVLESADAYAPTLGELLQRVSASPGSPGEQAVLP